MIESDLSGENLEGINLAEYRLHLANFRRANLKQANFEGADLSTVAFDGADLKGANFRGANMCGASLIGADCTNADLSHADLRRTDLECTNFSGTNLAGTCLDPKACVPHVPDEEILASGLTIKGEFIFGYRPLDSEFIVGDRNQGHNYDYVYEPGVCYTAPVFSVDVDTYWHPGIYFGGFNEVIRQYSMRSVLLVAALRSEVVHAGCKQHEGAHFWRAKRLLALETVKNTINPPYLQ